MIRKFRVLLLSFLLLTILGISSFTVQARNTEIVLTPGYYSGEGFVSASEVSGIPLSGKNTKDIIRVEVKPYRDDAFDISINGKKVHSVTGNAKIAVIDLNASDKRNEILIEKVETNSRTLEIYRYNGKELQKVFKDVWNFNKRYSLKTAQTKVLGLFDDTHDSNIFTTMMIMYPKGSKDYLILAADYKISNGKAKLSQLRVNGNKNGYKSSTKNKWVVYKYPRSSSNKKLYVIKNNDTYYAKSVKFNSKYLFLEVEVRDSKGNKVSKVPKTGWVIFPVKQFLVGTYPSDYSSAIRKYGVASNYIWARQSRCPLIEFYTD